MTIQHSGPGFRALHLVAALLICALLVLAVPAAPAAAEDGQEAERVVTETDYYITEYNMDITVNKNHSYDVVKEYKVNIPADLDRLQIKIPTGSYSVADIKIEGVDCKFSTDGNYRVITITSPEDLTAGEHTFLIRYQIEEYADHNDNMDMLYINVLPPDWDRGIVSLRITLSVPDDFNLDNLVIYSGQYGTKDDNVLRTVRSGRRIMVTGEDIPADYGITFKAELPNGYWQDVLDNAWTASFSFILMALALILNMLLWVIGGKDPKTVHTRESVPIEGVHPMDLGYIISGETRIRDIITLIIYLGIKGSLRICEYEPKRYKLIKLAEPKDEPRFVRGVYHTLFDDVYTGRALEMEDLGPRLRTALDNVSLHIESGYSSEDMQACTKLSRIFRIASLILLAVCVGILPILADLYEYKAVSLIAPFVLFGLTLVTTAFVANTFDNYYDLEKRVFYGRMAGGSAAFLALLLYAAQPITVASGTYLWVILIIILGGLSVFFICIMKARARGNAVLVARLLSLRRFIDRSDSYECADIMTENENYYYDMLPYAFQFSLIDKWAKKFRWLHVKPAAWYSDEIQGHAFTRGNRPSTTIEIAREMNTFARTIESEYQAMERKYRLFS